MEEVACGWPVMAMLYDVEDHPHYTSLVALVQMAQRLCSRMCSIKPDRCAVAYWCEKLEVPSVSDILPPLKGWGSPLGIVGLRMPKQT